MLDEYQKLLRQVKSTRDEGSGGFPGDFSGEGRRLKNLDVGIDEIKELIALGQGKGFLTYKEIADALEDLDMTEEEIDQVYREIKIGHRCATQKSSWHPVLSFADK